MRVRGRARLNSCEAWTGEKSSWCALGAELGVWTFDTDCRYEFPPAWQPAHPVPKLAVALEVVPLLLLLRLLALAAEALALSTATLVTASVAGPALEPLLLEAPLSVLRPDHRAVVDEVERVLLAAKRKETMSTNPSVSRLKVLTLGEDWDRDHQRALRVREA